MAISYYTQALNDNTKNPKTNAAESATFTLPITTMTPANAAAVLTAVGNLKTAIAGISNGVFAKSDIVYDRDAGSSARAASTLDQKENKYYCRYHDATDDTIKYRVSIPVADLGVLDDGEEFLDLTAGAGLTFKTAFEAVVVSDLNPANAVVLDSVQYVGRNS